MVKPKPPSSPPTLAEPPRQPVVDKYKGVRKRKWGKYVSEIRLPNSRERIWLGSYETAEQAARAFDAAQFCLRGHNAVFNFPHDPPNISGGQSLTPAEVQDVAAQYAYNNCNNQPARGETESKTIMELEGTSSSSKSDGAATSLESIDWSFLDMLDSDAAGRVSDFNLFSGVDSLQENVYVQPKFAHDGNDYNHDHDNIGNEHLEEHFSLQSFLWNF